jgi:hypothetical protein
VRPPTTRGGLLGKVAQFARSPEGKRMMRQATDYARSEKGKQQIAAARQRFSSTLAARRKRPPAR